jgi:hypothetical protein
MKNASLLCILCLLLLANTCKKTDKVRAALLDKTWLHSFEEDQGDTMAYRPNTYDFPPSRGRTGFALEADSVFRQYEIAPTDGLEEHVGTWIYDEENTISVHIPGNGNPAQNYKLEIISLKDGLLRVRRSPLPGSN